MSFYLLAIDQGTTNSRAIIFNANSNIVAQHEITLTQHFPKPGWVEQDPEEMYANTIACCRQALKNAKLSAPEIAAIGITNQRETTILWDRTSGRPVYPAIVWQDRRTSEICQIIAAKEIGAKIPAKTGLLIDPYFSASKILWLFENVPNAYERAARGELLFGTVDTYLLWKLTGGKAHVTDASNASRTMLFNIHTQEWDKEILSALDIPASILPTVVDNAANFGQMQASILGALIPITGMAGDQQAATIGQACFHPGMIKATYGTGGFLLLNTGSKVIDSQFKLLSTIAYRLNGKTTYGAEGSIFSTGETIKWLRDSLRIINTAAETEFLAGSIAHTDGLYLIPAFTGLGAPYWDPYARGALLGLSRKTDRAQIVRAALESVAYQTLDLLTAMRGDSKHEFTKLRVDGGMVANNWLLQFLADMLSIEVQRPTCIETTALGVAYLAGLQIGVYDSLEQIEQLWKMNLRFTPKMSDDKRNEFYTGWQQSIARIMSG